jgi:hypothetical protein
MILSQYHIFELDTINIYSVGVGLAYSCLYLDVENLHALLLLYYA